MPTELSALRGRNLLTNSLGIIATTVVSSGLGYVFWIVVARSFDDRAVGIATALIGAMTLTSIITSLGTGPALVQQLPRLTDRREWSATLNSSLLFGAVSSFAGGVIAALLVPEMVSGLGILSTSSGHVLLFAAGTSAWTLVNNLDYAFIAERASGVMLIRNLVFGVLRLPLLPAGVALAGSSALTVFAVWTTAAVVSGGLGLSVLVRRVEPAYLRRALGTTADLLKTSQTFLGNHLITLGNVLPFSLLPLMVVAALSPEASAHFYITWMLGGGFFMISSAVGSALFAEGGHKPEQLKRTGILAAGIVATMLLPLMAVFLLGGRAILELFGSAYAEDGHRLLLLLTLSAIPDAITNVYIAMMRAEGRLGHAARVNMGMAICTLVGSSLLLRNHGITGVGWAWIAAQTAGSLFVLVDVLRRAR